MRSPSTLATSSLPFAAGIPGNRFRNVIPVAPGVPLHILLQVKPEGATGRCGAGHTRHGWLSTAGTELLVHFLRSEEAAVAAEDEGF